MHPNIKGLASIHHFEACQKTISNIHYYYRQVLKVPLNSHFKGCPVFKINSQVHADHKKELWVGRLYLIFFEIFWAAAHTALENLYLSLYRV
jgi:hypothetical protein